MPAGWATVWRQRDGGWPHIISLLADHRPKMIRWIRRNSTLSEIATAYKDMRAAGEDAFDEVG